MPTDDTAKPECDFTKSGVPPFHFVCFFILRWHFVNIYLDPCEPPVMATFCVTLLCSQLAAAGSVLFLHFLPLIFYFLLFFSW